MQTRGKKVFMLSHYSSLPRTILYFGMKKIIEVESTSDVVVKGIMS
jgi:hypothetical protein